MFLHGKPVLTASRALLALRVAIAALVFVHGVWRATQGGVAPFGDWLTGQGVPFGEVVAVGVTLFEIVAAPIFAFGVFRPVIGTLFALIYATGMVMVHLPFGWFVVGAGRNGMEYSALLIVCFLLAGWARSDPR